MSDDVQRRHDAVRQDYDRKGLTEVFSALHRFSSPQNRAAETLLRLDLNETFSFVFRNPDAVRQVHPDA